MVDENFWGKGKNVWNALKWKKAIVNGLKKDEVLKKGEEPKPSILKEWPAFYQLMSREMRDFNWDTCDDAAERFTKDKHAEYLKEKNSRMSPKEWYDYWTNHIECSRRVWKFYQHLHSTKKLEQFKFTQIILRTLGMLRPSSAGVERHFSLLKRVMDVCGERIQQTNLEARLMVLVRAQNGLSWVEDSHSFLSEKYEA